jgi:hypothetical protein
MRCLPIFPPDPSIYPSGLAHRDVPSLVPNVHESLWVTIIAVSSVRLLMPGFA